jgi:hypothetical protein
MSHMGQQLADGPEVRLPIYPSSRHQIDIAGTEMGSQIQITRASSRVRVTGGCLCKRWTFRNMLTPK